jgi:hypothetical protein
MPPCYRTGVTSEVTVTIGDRCTGYLCRLNQLNETGGREARLPVTSEVTGNSEVGFRGIAEKTATECFSVLEQ